MTIYLAMAKPAFAWADLFKLLLPVALSAVASVIVTQERVAEIKSKVDAGILPIADERIRRLQMDVMNMQHEHEVMQAHLEEISQKNPGTCLNCHVHTPQKKRKIPLP